MNLPDDNEPLPNGTDPSAQSATRGRTKGLKRHRRYSARIGLVGCVRVFRSLGLPAFIETHLPPRRVKETWVSTNQGKPGVTKVVNDNHFFPLATIIICQ
jgi:hypothetical protein